MLKNKNNFSRVMNDGEWSKGNKLFLETKGEKLATTVDPLTRGSCGLGVKTPNTPQNIHPLERSCLAETYQYI